jgi:hypothetical protein
MAGRGRSQRRRINYIQIVFYLLSFIVVASMVLAMLPLAQQ